MNTDTERPQVTLDEEIEGGAVEAIEEVSFRPEEHRAQTSRWLAFVIVGLLAFSVAAHYGMVAWLLMRGQTEAATALGRIFEVWLPIISGLTSAAVTYYFTKERA
jgi:hypothetical protein